MKKKILALCDEEKEYLQQLTDYLQKKESFPFEIHAYTGPLGLVECETGKEIEMLLVAESAYTYEVSQLPANQILILGENLQTAGVGLPRTDKYQQAENIYRFIMDQYVQHGNLDGKQLCEKSKAAIIGLYSPVKRCLQTSFALTLGQVLARDYKTLYISFEHYAGWNGLLRKEGGKDLSDLLGYLDEGEKFSYRIRLIERKVGNLWYIPPVYAGQNLVYVTAAEWVKLIKRISAEGGYDYIILDLSESLQGIFELLRLCNRVYTIVCEDKPARSKLEQYEHLLRMQEYEDVLEKTKKQQLPRISELSGQIEQYTRGELADFVMRLVKGDLEVLRDEEL